jgi:hypothetical protein
LLPENRISCYTTPWKHAEIERERESDENLIYNIGTVQQELLNTYVFYQST